MKSFSPQKNSKLSLACLNFYGRTLSYSTFMKLLRKKDVKVNGKRTNKDIDVFVGDKIEVYYDGEKEEIEKLYFDDNVLVCYKPSGITSEDFFEQIKKEYPFACFIHRLDRNTDGIMIFSLTKSAENELIDGFKRRTFEKYYLCEVYGVPKEDNKTLQSYLVKDSENSLVKIYDKKVENSQKIETEYTVLKRNNETAVLKVKLITGKTHQIRAHLAHAGYFILGDGKYGDNKINKKFHLKNQRLTAYKLVLHFESNQTLAYLNGKEFILDTKNYGI